MKKEQADEISKLKEAAITKHLEAIDWAGRHQEATEQISRLKGVIAKYEEEFHHISLWAFNSMSSCREMERLAREALAAIKEIEK